MNSRFFQLWIPLQLKCLCLKIHWSSTNTLSESEVCKFERNVYLWEFSKCHNSFKHTSKGKNGMETVCLIIMKWNFYTHQQVLPWFDRIKFILNDFCVYLKMTGVLKAHTYRKKKKPKHETFQYSLNVLEKLAGSFLLKSSRCCRWWGHSGHCLETAGQELCIFYSSPYI